MRVEWSGTDKLAKKLKEKSEIRWDGVCLKNITEIYNRAKNGGTPVDTGELRISAGIAKPGNGFGGEAGYTKEYAPHVEYGHRTKDGGFIPGQHFLQNNVDAQRPIFKQDLIENLRKA